jgi:hypothetical protein
VGDKLTFEGINLLWLIFGLIGAALGISYMPPMTKGRMAAAIFAGLACAALFPQLAAHYYQTWFTTPIPPAINNTFAFVFGVLGMFIVPGIIVIGEKFQANPWWVIDFLRGKQ